jgi:hypothetical protein
MNHQIFERTLRFRDIPGSMPVRVSVNSTHPSPWLAMKLRGGLWAVLETPAQAVGRPPCQPAAKRRIQVSLNAETQAAQRYESLESAGAK